MSRHEHMKGGHLYQRGKYPKEVRMRFHLKIVFVVIAEGDFSVKI